MPNNNRRNNTLNAERIREIAFEAQDRQAIQREQRLGMLERAIAETRITEVGSLSYVQIIDTPLYNPTIQGSIVGSKKESEYKMKLDRKTKKGIKVYNDFMDKKDIDILNKKIVSLKKTIIELPNNDPISDVMMVELRECRKRLKNRQIRRYYSLPKYNVSTYITLNDNGGFRGINFNTPKEERDWVLNRLKEKIRDKRHELSSVQAEQKMYKSFRYYTRGGVHTKKGAILNICKNYKWDALRSWTEPDYENNYIGIEIEFFAPCNTPELERLLIKDNLHEQAYIKGDASIEWDDDEVDEEYYDYKGYELNLLCKEKEVYSIVDKVCGILYKFDAQVNETCGLHVHFDMRNRNYKKVFYNLYQMQELLYKFVDKDRQSNTYCKKITTGEWDESISHHYYGINGKDAYNKYETIEVRLHQGTINKTSIKNWIKLLSKIINHKRKVNPGNTESFSDYDLFYKFDRDVFEYYNKRLGA